MTQVHCGLPRPSEAQKTPPRTFSLVASYLKVPSYSAVGSTRQRGQDPAPIAATPSLAMFLPSLPLPQQPAHSRNKGNQGTSPLPGSADYLIPYPSITTSKGDTSWGVPARLSQRLGGCYWWQGLPIQQGSPQGTRLGPDTGPLHDPQRALDWYPWATPWPHPPASPSIQAP